MKIEDIKNKNTLKAIKHYSVPDEDTEKIENKEDLKFLLRRLLRKKWQRDNVQYFRRYYRDGYKDIVQAKKLFEMLPNVCIILHLFKLIFKINQIPI